MKHLYTKEAYATALSGEREPVYLAALDTWAIARPIAGSAHWDAMGPYPVTTVREAADLSVVRSTLAAEGLVTWTGVTDVLQGDLPWIEHAFDYVAPFKTHFLVDRSAGEVRFSKHHRYEVRRARRTCSTRVISLGAHLGDWAALYGALIDRHEIGPRHRFSDRYFQMLAESDDVTMVGAFVEERLVCAHLWVTSTWGVYSHLAASGREGYDCGAAYGVVDHAISHFADQPRIDLGGVAKAEDDTSTGLGRFKRGFSNATGTNHIVGIIADRPAYESLLDEGGANEEGPNYFPAYRGP